MPAAETVRHERPGPGQATIRRVARRGGSQLRPMIDLAARTSARPRRRLPATNPRARPAPSTRAVPRWQSGQPACRPRHLRPRPIARASSKRPAARPVATRPIVPAQFRCPRPTEAGLCDGGALKGQRTCAPSCSTSEPDAGGPPQNSPVPTIAGASRQSPAAGGAYCAAIAAGEQDQPPQDVRVVLLAAGPRYRGKRKNFALLSRFSEPNYS